MRPLAKRIRNAVGCGLLLLLQRIAWRLPRRRMLALGRFLGRIGWRIATKERRRAREHLALAFPDRDEEWRVAVGEHSFENLGMGLLETLCLPRMSAETIRGLADGTGALAAFGARLDRGERVVFLTGHIGNWEMLAALSTALGIPMRPLARRIHIPALDALIRRIRESRDVRQIDNDASPRRLLRLMREGIPVSFVGDQELDDVAGVFVDFFGRPAYTPVAPAALARKAGATIGVFALAREGERFRLLAAEPFRCADTGDRAADLETDTRRWTAALEAFIRQVPEQWVWNHRRWRSDPARIARKQARTGRRAGL